MITGRQIRAARALMEWTAEDLARKAGLTRVTISNLEEETARPQEKTLNSILNVFDKHGVDFTEDEGVRIRRNEIRFFSGKAGFRQLLDHIYDTVKDKGGHIYQFTSANRYLSYAEDYVDVHIERISQVPNLDVHVLTIEGDVDFPADYCTYRWLDKSYAAIAPFCVYGDYVIMALHEAAYKKELVVIRSKLLAERYIGQFNFLWDKAVEPPKKKRTGGKMRF